MMRSIMVTILVLHVVIGQSEASFLTCFKDCVPTCFAGGQVIGGAICSATCIAKRIHEFEENLSDSYNNKCALSCAQSSCVNISTRDNISNVSRLFRFNPLLIIRHIALSLYI